MTETSTFLQACKGERTEQIPVWLMRQAGRYQPEYRELRKKYRMLELCQNPDLVTEVTLMPIKRCPFDAAILFSDITIPYFGLGIEFDLKPNVGPVIEQPIRSAADVSRLRPFKTAEALPYISQSIKQLREVLEVPLIGFAGAPFTLAAYLIEGKPSKDYRLVKSFMYREHEAWNELMTRLVDCSIDYLSTQVEAGAQALQIFDSWVGALSPSAYCTYLQPHMKRLFEGLESCGVPVIHFGTGTALLLRAMHDAGGDVMGIDSRTPLRWGWEQLGGNTPVQGNLDSAFLLTDWETLRTETTRLLEEAEAVRDTGYIFNLGHGITPETPTDNVAKLIDFVHGWQG